MLEQLDVNIGTKKSTILNAVLKLLHTYPECIATNMSEVGITSHVEMKIIVTCVSICWVRKSVS